MSIATETPASFPARRALGRHKREQLQLDAVSTELQAALADCNQSLALRPNDANTLDSRGFVYLKLGQFDNAIADYDTALRINPKIATSLFGRGTAKLKTGNSTAGNSDIAAAKAIQADIADQMAALGISP